MTYKKCPFYLKIKATGDCKNTNNYYLCRDCDGWGNISTKTREQIFADSKKVRGIAFGDIDDQSSKQPS